MKPEKDEDQKKFMERAVPELIREGVSFSEAMSRCTASWVKASTSLTPEVTKKLCFCAELTPEGFKLIIPEDSDEAIESMGFAEIFAVFGCTEGTTYEFEIEVEEC